MSPGTGRRYPLTMVCAVYRVPRSSVYAAAGREAVVEFAAARKRGPRTLWSDEEVLQAIREVLKESRFLGEGHRKVRARLRRRGMRGGKEPGAADHA